MAFVALGRALSAAAVVMGASVVSMVALQACDDTTATDETEDKDGVNEVPGPTMSNGNPSGGLGGGGGMGGGNQGMPCMQTIECDDANPCTTENCVMETCQVTSAADDGNACTTDMCDPATGAITNTPVQVNDNNACTYDVCDPVTGATNPTFFPVFAEDFSNNAQGWVLGPQWFIGSAAPSTGALDGGNDPAFDHSLSSDDGIAGTGQGSLVADTPVPSYLTSPPISVQAFVAGESATLRYWRWLNSDAPPTMTVTLEISIDGSNYTPIWANQGRVIDAPPAGTGWFEVRHDVTAAVQQARTNGQPVRFRWGFDKNMSAVSIGGWNVDDVSLERSLISVDADLCTVDGCLDMGGVPTATSTPMPAVDDGNDCTAFQCIPNSDGPNQVAIPNCP